MKINIETTKDVATINIVVTYSDGSSDSNIITQKDSKKVESGVPPEFSKSY